VSAVLVGEVGTAVADPVALRKRAIQQDVVRIGLAQGAQQAGRAVGQQVDDGCHAGVRGTDKNAKPGSDLSEVSFKQALLVLAPLRKNETFAQAAAGFGGPRRRRGGTGTKPSRSWLPGRWACTRLWWAWARATSSSSTGR
jgi:hypothetical protein